MWSHLSDVYYESVCMLLLKTWHLCECQVLWKAWLSHGCDREQGLGGQAWVGVTKVPFVISLLGWFSDFAEVPVTSSPREPHALAWGPSSSHTKIFRVQASETENRGKNYWFLVNFTPTDSLDISLLVTVRLASIRSWQIYEILTFCLPGGECCLVCCCSAMLSE